MTDEIRSYHVDDPNDAPERRLGANFSSAINPFNSFNSLPTSLPQYVIPPVAECLYTAMRYYWYSAYHQGIAAQKQQQQQQQQQQQHHHQQQQQPHAHQTHHQLTHSQQPPPQPQTQVHHQLQPPSHHQQQHYYTHLQPQTQAHPSSLASTSNSPASSSSPSSSTSSASSSSSSASSSSSTAPPTSAASPVTSTTPASNDQQKHQHIKKPLNPFMIYMQKRRPEIVKQGIIKESAAINQMLGQQWRKLSKEEQEPYYKLAEQEKILHAQKYPGWSARDNYANQKKKKKLKLKSISLNGLDQSDKKCRARFGLNNMASWCKPCKRKKKCIYSMASTPTHHHNHYHHHQDYHHQHNAAIYH